MKYLIIDNEVVAEDFDKNKPDNTVSDKFQQILKTIIINTNKSINIFIFENDTRYNYTICPKYRTLNSIGTISSKEKMIINNFIVKKRVNKLKKCK